MSPERDPGGTGHLRDWAGQEVWQALTSAPGRALIAQLTPWDEAEILPRLSRLRSDPQWAGHPDVIAAAATQARLRTRAGARFPGPARWWTPAGLEQATRPALARRHTERMLAAGIRVVHDLGCGAGSDALAFAAAGISVRAVDLDSAALAALATTAADLGVADLIHPITADIRQYVAALHPDGREALFLDPARRDAAGARKLRPHNWSPPWHLVCELGAAFGTVGAKVAPGIPHEQLPAAADTQWISQDGDLLEASVWWPGLGGSGIREALVLRGPELVARIDDRQGVPTAPVGPVGNWLVEPDPGVIRSGLVSVLAAQLGGWLLDPNIAYITGSGQPPLTPLADTYAVDCEVPVARKALRKWLTAAGFSNVVIKKRGLELDPVELRRWLRLRGDGPEATLVLTRTATGPFGVAVHRAPRPACTS